MFCSAPSRLPYTTSCSPKRSCEFPHTCWSLRHTRSPSRNMRCQHIFYLIWWSWRHSHSHSQWRRRQDPRVDSEAFFPRVARTHARDCWIVVTDWPCESVTIEHNTTPQSAAQQQHSSSTAAAQQQHSSSTAAAQQQHSSSTAAAQQHSSTAAQQHSSTAAAAAAAAAIK